MLTHIFQPKRQWERTLTCCLFNGLFLTCSGDKFFILTVCLDFKGDRTETQLSKCFILLFEVLFQIEMYNCTLNYIYLVHQYANIILQTHIFFISSLLKRESETNAHLTDYNGFPLQSWPWVSIPSVYKNSVLPFVPNLMLFKNPVGKNKIRLVLCPWLSFVALNP